MGFAPLAALGDPPIPADNPMSEAKIELGKMLFWDPRLGGDASTACVTCHEPDQGWAFSDSSVVIQPSVSPNGNNIAVVSDGNDGSSDVWVADPWYDGGEQDEERGPLHRRLRIACR